MESNAFLVNLTPQQKIALRRRAALLTVETGKQTTMSDLVRDVIDQIIATPIQMANEKSNAIKFTPRPKIAEALKQAHFNSGKPVSDIVNQMLEEALHAEGVSL